MNHYGRRKPSADDAYNDLCEVFANIDPEPGEGWDLSPEMTAQLCEAWRVLCMHGHAGKLPTVWAGPHRLRGKAGLE